MGAAGQMWVPPVLTSPAVPLEGGGGLRSAVLSFCASVLRQEVESSEVEMTSTVERESISEALALIDRGLVNMVKRDLVTTIEVADLLLDVRALLATTDEPTP